MLAVRWQGFPALGVTVRGLGSIESWVSAVLCARLRVVRSARLTGTVLGTGESSRHTQADGGLKQTQMRRTKQRLTGDIKD